MAHIGPLSSKAAWLVTFHDFLGELYLHTTNLFLLEDINFDLMKNHSFSTDNCSKYDLKQLITKPTRITQMSLTLLD